MIISQMLKEKRKEYQLTQEQLAEKIFVSNKTISNWETDKTKPDIESLILLAKLFDLSLDNLLLEESDMVKSINKDIKKGRNLKKIILLVTLPLIAIIVVLFWLNYQGNNMTIVPLDDISNIELSTPNLTDTTKIKANVNLKKFESLELVDVVIEDKTIYLMVYKGPKIFSKKSDFTVDLEEKLKNYRLFANEIDKIVFTYWDTKESNGFDTNELTNIFPKKIIWERLKLKHLI